MKKVINCKSNYICKNCKKHILKGNVPKLAANENFKFPDVPDFIKNLLPIEERMVSPYIPFMQIRALLPAYMPYAINPQLSLKGSIVNVHSEINEMIKILPRKFNEMSVIQIKLKRHIEHKSDYMYETIKPSNVYRALEYLLNTPLYKQNNITVNKNFLKSFDHNVDTVNFIVNKENEDDNSINDEHANNNNTYDSDDDSFDKNDEVLIIDRNQEIVNDVKVIAPGQDKEPLPWHKTENIDELCFPRIFGGYMIDIEKKLTYSERTLSEIRRRDRRSCNPTRLLFMAKQKLEKSVFLSMNACLRKLKTNENLTADQVLDSNKLNDIF